MISAAVVACWLGFTVVNTSAAGDREGQQQLVREIGPGKGRGVEIALHPRRRALREMFGGHAKLAETG